MAIGAAIAGVVVSAGSAVYSGVQQKKTADYNAAIAEAEAYQENEENKEQLRRDKARNEQLLARQKAIVGSAGVLSSEGTPLEQLAESASMMELEALDKRRYSLARQSDLNTQAAQLSSSGSNAQTAGFMSAAATTLNSYSQYKAGQ